VASGLVLLVTPFAVEDSPGTLNQMQWKYCPVRYGTCFLSLAVLAFAVALRAISQHLHACAIVWRGWWSGPVRYLSYAPWVFLAAGLIVQLRGVWKLDLDMTLREGLLLVTDLLLIGMIVRLAWANWPSLRRPLVLLLAGGMMVGVAFGGDWLAHRWHSGFAAHYDRMLAGGLFRYLNETQPAGSRICVLDFRSYPFFGSSRQFRVCQPRRIRSREDLDEYVRSRGVTIIAARFDTRLPLRGWQTCWRWLAEDDSAFVPLRNRSWPYTVYQVIPPADSGHRERR
jgi:hypothetical protein